MPFFIAEVQDVNWRFITRLNCRGCLLKNCIVPLFVCSLCQNCERETVSLGKRWLFLMFFLLFSFSVFFHCPFDLLCTAFSISSNVYQAPWLLLWWKQCHHLTPISYINDKGECLTYCCLRFMLLAWGHEQKNGGILVDLLASAYFLFASGKLPSWTTSILNSSKAWTVRSCIALNVPSVSQTSTAHGSTY